MIPAYKPIPQQQKARLKARGYKQYVKQPLHPFFTAGTPLYNNTSAVIFGLAAIGRHMARKSGYIYWPFTVALCSVPASMYHAFRSYDNYNESLGHRKQLKHLIESELISKEALKRACAQIDNQIQDVQQKIIIAKERLKARTQ